jgi:hypothetical protein
MDIFRDNNRQFLIPKAPYLEALGRHAPSSIGLAAMYIKLLLKLQHGHPDSFGNFTQLPLLCSLTEYAIWSGADLSATNDVPSIRGDPELIVVGTFKDYAANTRNRLDGADSIVLTVLIKSMREIDIGCEWLPREVQLMRLGKMSTNEGI